MAIPLHVRECFEAFPVGLAGEEEASCLEDELGRFKIWGGNIAAHGPVHSRRSLEYRLRDSSGLRQMVLSLLQDLMVAIHDLRKQLLCKNTLMTHDRLSDESTTQAIHQGTEVPPNDTENGDVDMFELSDEESIDEDTPVRKALVEIHDVITCLLRFSMTLRRPSRDDQRRDDPGGVAEAFVLHDTEHVRAKFPDAPDYLVRRLGKALSKHRQYFRYRREHHQKLHEGLGEGDARAWELPSTVATSLPNDTSDAQKSSGLRTDSETESAYTATSYEGTAMGKATLRVPPWPTSAQTGSPFECPICFGIIVADSEISWRRHVFEDLPPYVCVSGTCVSAVKSFSRRREWARHNDTMHERIWVCPDACVNTMTSPAKSSSHLAAEHAHAALPSILQKTTIASEQTAEANTSSLCPLCTRLCNSKKSWTKHVGHHLEQLALFSLPMELFSTDTPDNSDEEPKDDGAHSSAPSSGSENAGDDDNLPEDSKYDADEMQASELLVPDAPNPIVDPMEVSSMQPNDIDAVPYEPSSEHDNQGYVISPADTNESEDDTLAEEVRKLREMIEQQDEERAAREATVKAEIEARQLKAEQEQEALKAGEKSLVDVEAETAATKNKPHRDIDQPPVLFKDAVGRKFSFPWHLCKTWKGMESLIKQAFLHIDVIGAHVKEGHYDLVGPDGEFILPWVWETVVKPGMRISMHMWPVPETPRKSTDRLLTKAAERGLCVVEASQEAQGRPVGILESSSSKDIGAEAESPDGKTSDRDTKQRSYQ